MGAHASAGAKEAPFTSEVALSTRQFPFDWDPPPIESWPLRRYALDLTLVTADQRLLGPATSRLWRIAKHLHSAPILSPTEEAFLLLC